ncbi:hypothetical protein BDE02_03G074400 [Populus trichocarpa]|nr:hypothetical protein BDE02_03G074400 [Populus trichocarpa]
MYLVNCQQLSDIQGLGSVGNKPLIYVDNCSKLANNFKSLLQASFKGEHLDICLRDSEIPDWFSHRGDGSSISFYVPDSEIQGLIVWIVCGASEKTSPTLRFCHD